ncbi:hypothetical protein ACWCXX_39400 [Streptomyces sp. NPDC001732]
MLIELLVGNRFAGGGQAGEEDGVRAVFEPVQNAAGTDRPGRECPAASVAVLGCARRLNEESAREAFFGLLYSGALTCEFPFVTNGFVDG